MNMMLAMCGLLYPIIACPSMALRLMNGSMVSEREGRVEICYNNTFNTICDDFWDDLDARVVCNQLGFTGSGKKQSQTTSESVLTFQHHAC